ncbi:RAD51 DNA repair protein spindle D isoform X2 [Rhodnius prolixus]|uniref:RAD51 DNA repair protein spindle D isoform X2 n=1 Tax=Rhodnius prolixus TaxID=13249 RepID=UPI003D18D547
MKILMQDRRMRPLYTFPLPQVLIDALTNSGFTIFEDLFDENEKIHEHAEEILKQYSYSVSDIKALVALPSITTAALLLRSEELNESIPTFSEALDGILGGGVRLDSLLHVCGPPGSGKTLLSLQLCIAVQVPECLGGLEAQAVFIDTDFGFTVSRLREIAEGAYNYCIKVAEHHNLIDSISKFSADTMLEKVHYLPARNHYQLLAAVQILKQFVAENSKIKVVIVDSIIFPFLNVSNTLERTRLIYSVLNQLYELADTYNLAVIVTNHLTTKISKFSKYLAPSLGESLSHRIPQTLLLGRYNNVFSAVVTKSPNLPETVAHFSITKDGLTDVT